MDEWKEAYSSDNFYYSDEGLGSALSEIEEDNIKELKLRILENEYEMKTKNVIDRLLWYGVHIFRVSNQCRRNNHQGSGTQGKAKLD